MVCRWLLRTLLNKVVVLSESVMFDVKGCDT